MKNTASDVKITLEGINSMLDEVEDQIRYLEDKLTKNTKLHHQNKKGFKRMSKP